MTVYKTFLKILNKLKVPIIMYTVFLIIFGGFNIQTNDNSINFTAVKPDIYIVNEDTNEGITKNLIKYLSDNANIIELKNTEESLNDALFYRDVNYIVYIPKDYSKDFMNGKNPEIKIKSTGDYQASLAELILKRYVNTANNYLLITNNEDELIKNINDNLSVSSNIKTTSKLDDGFISRAAGYYNFLNYSILAGCVYVICLILATFNDNKIKKRTTISSVNYKSFNFKLLLSNISLAIVLWLFYIILSIVLIGKDILSMYGVIFALNAFVLTICGTALAFMLGSLQISKNALNGVINVVALGSSFLCGAFVPMEWLPDYVLGIAHVLPSYYYIKSNELLKTLEVLNFETLRPIFINMIIILIFTVLFIIITNYISRKKAKIG